MDKVKVHEEGENWVIENRPGFKPLEDFTRPDATYTDILVTPGMNPDDPTDIRPYRIVMPKKYADVHALVSEVIPAIRTTEEKCEVCKRAREILLSSH